MKEEKFPRVMQEYDKARKGENYFTTIAEYRWLIILITILVGLSALIFSLAKPVTYDAVTDLSVVKINREATNDFQYDNYYAIQASELLGNTVVSWFKTPDFIAKIYAKASIAPGSDLNKLAKSFKAKQNSSHTIDVKTNDSERDRAQKLADALIVITRENVEDLEKNSKNEPSFTVKATAPIIFQNKYNPYIVGGIGLIAGALLGIGIAFLIAYFKKDSEV